MANDNDGMVVVTKRHIPFPPEALFAAFADPERLKLWWGPDGFANTIHALDFRTGGEWRFTMHAPDGGNFDNTCTFSSIEPGRKITFTHHLPMHVFTMTMTYEPDGEGTNLTWHMVFEPNETNAAVRPFVEDGNEQNFNRLEAHLKGTL